MKAGIRIGIAGYSNQKFDTEEALRLLYEALEELGIYTEYDGISFFVSGLTNLGIPKLAYEFAKNREIPTMGIACKKAEDYECYPCSRIHIVGENWGDESEAFLASIDVLIRIGGGPQSMAECEAARSCGIRVIEKELEAIA